MQVTPQNIRDIVNDNIDDIQHLFDARFASITLIFTSKNTLVDCLGGGPSRPVEIYETGPEKMTSNLVEIRVGHFIQPYSDGVCIDLRGTFVYKPPQ
jgi:hypothetical protein